MNLPNKLTLLRIIMIPFFVVFMLWEGLAHHYLYALIIFAAASYTDMLDGQIARKNNLVTDFGKFMDPIADKLLVCSAYVVFVELGICNSWVLIFILAREFAVTSLRLVASVGGGKVIAANYWGKLKTVSQMIATIAVMLLQEVTTWNILPAAFPVALICNILIWISVAFTIISGIVYLVDNKKFIDPSK